MCLSGGGVASPTSLFQVGGERIDGTAMALPADLPEPEACELGRKGLAMPFDSYGLYDSLLLPGLPLPLASGSRLKLGKELYAPVTPAL